MSSTVDIETAIYNFWKSSPSLQSIPMSSGQSDIDDKFPYATLTTIDNRRTSKTRTGSAGTIYRKYSGYIKVYGPDQYSASEVGGIVESALQDADMHPPAGSILQVDIPDGGRSEKEDESVWRHIFRIEILNSSNRLR